MNSIIIYSTNILILLFSIYFALHIFNKFNKNNKIIFINKNETITILNNTNYFNKFNKIDFKVRGCNSISNCINLYVTKIKVFTKFEKAYINKLVSIIDKYAEKYKSFNNISWKFSKFEGNIENQFPFTLDDTIFLNTTFFSKQDIESDTETLLHEKLHIYQRYNEKKTITFYNNLGFQMKPCICNYTQNHRTNPDVPNTHYVYKGYLVRNQYSTNARSLSNVNIIFNRVNGSEDYDGEKILKQIRNNYGANIEHPNEIFATLIAKFILIDIDFNNYFNNFSDEVKRYLI
jgi:hypothetical protein